MLLHPPRRPPWIALTALVIAAVGPPGAPIGRAEAAPFSTAALTPGSLRIAIPNTCPIDIFLANVTVLKSPAFLTNARVTAFSPSVLGGETGTILISFQTLADADVAVTTDDFIVQTEIRYDGGSQTVQKSIPVSFKSVVSQDVCVNAVQYEPGHTRVDGDAEVTSVPDNPGIELPAAITLGDAFPNPLSGGRLVIPFALPAPAHTSIRIFDVTGRLVRQLGDRPYAAGSHEDVWDTRDGEGQRVASGLYFYTLTVNGRTYRRSVAVVK